MSTNVFILKLLLFHGVLFNDENYNYIKTRFTFSSVNTNEMETLGKDELGRDPIRTKLFVWSGG